MRFSVDHLMLAEMMLRRHRTRTEGLSPEAAGILIIFLAVCGVIVYFSIRAKKNGIMQALEFDNETDYRIFKESCPIKYGSFYMSADWTVNESSLKYYRTSDIFDVSPMLPGSSGENTLTRRGILIRYSGGTDKLFVNQGSERDRIVIEINAFLKKDASMDLLNRIY